MTIIEAIKTGRRIKKPGYGDFITPSMTVTFTPDDILCEDWIVEAETVSIIKVQLHNALLKHFSGFYHPDITLFPKFFNDLGFKD